MLIFVFDQIKDEFQNVIFYKKQNLFVAVVVYFIWLISGSFLVNNILCYLLQKGFSQCVDNFKFQVICELHLSSKNVGWGNLFL